MDTTGTVVLMGGLVGLVASSASRPKDGDPADGASPFAETEGDDGAADAGVSEHAAGDDDPEDERSAPPPPS